MSLKRVSQVATTAAKLGCTDTLGGIIQRWATCLFACCLTHQVGATHTCKRCCHPPHARPVLTAWLLHTQTLWRLLDAYLNEGPKVLARVAIAIVKARAPALKAATSVDEVSYRCYIPYPASQCCHHNLSPSTYCCCWSSTVHSRVER